MSPPVMEKLSLAINRQGKMKVHFALTGNSFDKEKCKLEVGRRGEPKDWKCGVVRKDTTDKLLVGWFEYKSKDDADEKRNDDKDTEELEFVVTNPGSPPVTFPAPTTTVDDTP